MEIDTKNNHSCLVQYSEASKRFIVSFAYHPLDVQKIKSIPGALWHKKQKVWSIPPSHRILKKLELLFYINIAPGDDVTRKIITKATEKEKLIDSANIKKKKDLDLPTDYDFKREPMEHQLAAFNWARKLTEVMLAMEVGTGKTKVALDLLQDRFNSGAIENALIIAPKSILYKWKKEVELDTNLKAVVIDGTKEKRIKLLNSNHQVFIINYEGVRSTKELFENARFGMIIADESHLLKNGKAITSKTIYKIVSDYRACLTGTPVAGSLLDLWGQFYFLDKGETFYEKYWPFKEEFFVDISSKSVPYEKLIPIKEKIPMMEQRFSRKSIRYLKQECLDLPDQVIEFRDIELTKQQAKAYMDMVKDSITFIGDKAATAEVRAVDYIRYQQITSGFIKTEDGEEVAIPGANPKMDELISMLNGELRGQKIIIWAKFTRDVNELCDKLKDFGVVKIDGSVKGLARFENIEKFQTDPSIQIIVCQPDAGAQGIDLTAAGVAVYYSYTWKWDKYEQSFGRNHRKGTEEFGFKKITYILFRAKVNGKLTIDHAILRSMDLKQDFSDMVTGDNYIRKILSKSVSAASEAGSGERDVPEL